MSISEVELMVFRDGGGVKWDWEDVKSVTWSSICCEDYAGVCSQWVCSDDKDDYGGDGDVIMGGHVLVFGWW